MNRKSVYSLILAVALAVSFAFPAFADDLATASDADYYSNQLLSVESSAKAAASELSPLYSVNAQNQWTQLSYDNSLNYVWVPSDCTRLCWIAPSGTRHLRLRVDSSDLGKTFYNSFGSSSWSALRLQTNLTNICEGVNDGNYVTFTFIPTRDLNTSDLLFYVDKGIGKENLQGVFYYVSSSSSYIPASDTGQQGQTTAANTTIIKNVVTNISNTVSNISNQITTSTTTITNAVNNVANQVTGSINSQTNTLSDKIQGQTNTITNNQNQNTDKVIQNQKENTDKVIKNQDENTDKVVKNQDENTTKVTEKLEDVKTGIINGIIEGLKNLFIPSDDFFKSYFDDLYSWFGERLGFLSFPIDLLAELAEMFLGSSSTDCILTLPSFSISGFTLWEESTFNLTSFLNENFKFVLDALKLGTSVILVFNFIHLCERKWEEVMMN